jgi:AraC-like DNA-binding protein
VSVERVVWRWFVDQLTDSSDAENTVRRQFLENVARNRLDLKLTELFRDLTGWECEVKWAPPLAWAPLLPFMPSDACASICREREALAACTAFEEECLERTLHCGEGGYAFTCPFGINGYWQSVVVEGLPLAIICFKLPATGAEGRRSGDRRKPSKAGMERSVASAKKLMLVLADEIRLSILAESRLEDVKRLKDRITAHEQIEARLRRATKGSHPGLSHNSPTTAAANHHTRTIQDILTHIHAHYDKPLRLQDFADRIGMNMSHLSTVFSRAVGMPFRAYVKELRLEQAESLLRDPTRRISEVAYAVGYTDPNRFRLDFKDRTGLSPTSWRDALL